MAEDLTRLWVGKQKDKRHSPRYATNTTITPSLRSPDLRNDVLAVAVCSHLLVYFKRLHYNRISTGSTFMIQRSNDYEELQRKRGTIVDC